MKISNIFIFYAFFNDSLKKLIWINHRKKKVSLHHIFRRILHTHRQTRLNHPIKTDQTYRTNPEQHYKMPTLPHPVRVCGFSHEVYSLSTTGFYSVEYDMWFANPTCYQLMRLKNGDLNMKNNPDLVKTLIETRNRHYSPEVLMRNRNRLTRDLKNGTYKIVRRVHRGNGDVVDE